MWWCLFGRQLDHFSDYISACNWHQMTIFTAIITIIITLWLSKRYVHMDGDGRTMANFSKLLNWNRLDVDGCVIWTFVDFFLSVCVWQFWPRNIRYLTGIERIIIHWKHVFFKFFFVAYFWSDIVFIICSFKSCVIMLLPVYFLMVCWKLNF